MSLRDLANAIHYNRSYISNVEAAKRLPEKKFAELADRELRAAGKLLFCWQEADEERRSRSKIHRTLLTAGQESEFLAALDAEEIDSEPVGGIIGHLAISYLNTPPAPMLAQAAQLRSTIVKTLRSHERPGRSKLNISLRRAACQVCCHMRHSILAHHAMRGYMPQQHLIVPSMQVTVSLLHGPAGLKV